MRAALLVPLAVQQELIGILAATAEHPDLFTPAHEEILEEIAASLAVALQQARLLAQTQRDAETKALLLHEVNHRVMNNLAIILSILELEMEQQRPNKADFEAVLQDIYGRIQGMTTVHHMLSSD